MAIEMHQLVNRKHNDQGDCIGFRYVVPCSEDWPELEFKFDRYGDRTWVVTLHWPWPGLVQLYTVDYDVPKVNMDLVMVCVIGLQYFSYALQAEVQAKSEMQFLINDVVDGVVHG